MGDKPNYLENVHGQEPALQTFAASDISQCKGEH